MLTLAATLACSKNAAAPDAGAPASPPPPIEVRAERTDLVFSYLQEDGRTFGTATEIGAVPEAARRAVVVTDLSLSPERRQAGRYVYLADLRAARADGTYPVALASRYGFETGSSTVAGGVRARGEAGVIIYSASWCGVCKTAKRALDGWGVAYVEKDIEASRAAATELAEKAAAAGFRPGGVPVIDVSGSILQGFDERSLRAALQAKKLL